MMCFKRCCSQYSRISQCSLAALALAVSSTAVAEETKKGFESVEKTILGTENWMVLGLGVGALPEFEGAEDYEVLVVPVIDIQRGRFFVRTDDGIGLHLIDASHFLMGVSVTWMRGYDDSDIPDGIGELDDEMGGKIFATARFGGLLTTLSAIHVLDEADEGERGQRGYKANLRVAYPYKLTQKLTIVPHIEGSWASEEYMNSYFGVNEVQADRSGLTLYEPEAGAKSVTLGIGLNYQLNSKWSVIGAVDASQLMENAEDSPLVESDTQSRAVLGFTYAF